MSTRGLFVHPGADTNFLSLAMSAYDLGRFSFADNTIIRPDIPTGCQLEAAQALFTCFRNGAMDEGDAISRRQAISDAVPVAGPPQAPPVTQPERSQRPRVAVPPNFHGTDRAKLDEFLDILAMNFSASPNTYTTENSKIATAGSYLKDSAHSWFHPHLDRRTGAYAWTTYADFLSAFEAAFGDPNPRKTAEDKLRALKQGNRECSQVLAEFLTITAVLHYSDENLISAFEHVLNEGVTDRIYSQPEPPTSFEEFSKLCIVMDNNQRAYERRYGSTSRRQPTIRPFVPTYSRNFNAGPQPRPQYPQQQTVRYNPRSTAFGNHPGPMDLGATQRRGPLTEAEKRHRREKNLCLYCGGAGHFANTCPNKFQPQRMVNMAYTYDDANNFPRLEEAKN